MTDFYLISGELVPELQYEPRACIILRRLRNAVRDDFALVRVGSPIPKEIHYADEDVSELMLVARHEGKSLFRITEWPVAVNVCRLTYKKGEAIPGDIGNNFRIVDWGVIYPTREEAEASLRLLLGDRIRGRTLL